MSDIIYLKDEVDYNNLKQTLTVRKSNMKVKFTCSICGEIKSKNFTSVKFPFVCRNCNCRKAQLLPETKIKAKNTKLCLYGDENYNNKDKAKQTCIEKYGVEHASQSESVKQKVKQTCLEKYGVEYAGQAELVKQNIKKTCIEKYGVNNTFQAELVKQKVKQTCIKKYGVDNYTKTDGYRVKSKQTCLDRYGVEYPSQTNIFKQKVKQTCLERYGVENISQTEETKQKVKQTCLERYGVEYSLKADKIRQKVKQTCLERYGVENISQTEETKQKVKQTCLERYGVECYAQTQDFAKKARKKIKFNDMSFDSNDELTIYKFCEEHNIPIEYQPCSLKYIDGFGNEHIYFPDFEINDQLYEVKGDHLWKDGHIWFPYRNTLNEEQLLAIDSRDLAKTECMKQNNVTVILSSQIKNFLESLIQ